MAIVITSDDRIPINVSFKVSAGPGAGKTHWLINHIKNVLSQSSKLGAVKKIACITYTNVGTDTILKRLRYDNTCVEVTTIHSFLFENVVKPYIYLIANEVGLKYDSLLVIDDSSLLSKGMAYLLLKKMGKAWIDSEFFLKGLRKSRWQYKDKRFTDFKPIYAQKARKGSGYNIPNNAYLFYKHFLWKKGRITFDDIIYFSWRIFTTYPNVYALLKAKYPYFFVDEFQDTIPFVVDFLKFMGNQGTIIGVVGDKAQAIYDFVGATARQFDDFSVPNMIEYEIHGNRRSTLQIINLLNAIRTEFSQNHLSGEEDEMPLVMIGDKLDCYQRAMEMCQTNDVKSLAYPNIIANSMRLDSDANLASCYLDDDFDTNIVRQRTIKTLLKAVEYARLNDLREAWRQLDSMDADRTKTIVWLRRLLAGYNEYKSGTLMDFYSFIFEKLDININAFNKGAARSFYLTHKYQDAALGVNGVDTNTIHKTIHKSKGDEFDFVFVILNDEREISFLTNPNLNDNNAHRVYYVGISRARRRLFINVPTLCSDNESLISALPVKIMRIV